MGAYKAFGTVGRIFLVVDRGIRCMKTPGIARSQNRKLRVLHSAALLSPTSGMLAQMEWELDAANTLDVDWHVRMYCPINCQARAAVLQYDSAVDATRLNTPLKKLFAWIKFRFNYHRWLLKRQNDFDVFVLRYYVHDPFQLWFVRRCRKPIFFVHHTLEIPELAFPGGVVGFIRSRLELLLGRPTIASAAGTIGVTQEIVDHELTRAGVLGRSSYVYPNGIVFKSVTLPDRRSLDVPELLFVANFSPWHGLDVLLDSVSKSDEKFVLHLVGKIPDALFVNASDSRIKVHGPMGHQEIAVLSQKCWVGLSSFALFRKDMKQACPLKVREYLMLGLPVYGDYQDVFPDNSPFFCTGSERVDEILGFARTVRGLSKMDVAKMSRGYINKIDLLDGLVNYIGSKYD